MLTLAIGGLVQARFSNGSFDFIKYVLHSLLFDSYYFSISILIYNHNSKPL